MLEFLASSRQTALNWNIPGGALRSGLYTLRIANKVAAEAR